MVGLQTRSAVRAYNQLRTNYDNPSVMLAQTAPLTQGSQGWWFLRLPCCSDWDVSRNSNPSVSLRRQLPLHRGAKDMDITHAVIFHRGDKGMASSLAALLFTHSSKLPHCKHTASSKNEFKIYLALRARIYTRLMSYVFVLCYLSYVLCY